MGDRIKIPIVYASIFLSVLLFSVICIIGYFRDQSEICKRNEYVKIAELARLQIVQSIRVGQSRVLVKELLSTGYQEDQDIISVHVQTAISENFSPYNMSGLHFEYIFDKSDKVSIIKDGAFSRHVDIVSDKSLLYYFCKSFR
jgi:hypothetical protein